MRSGDGAHPGVGRGVEGPLLLTGFLVGEPMGLKVGIGELGVGVGALAASGHHELDGGLNAVLKHRKQNTAYREFMII